MKKSITFSHTTTGEMEGIAVVGLPKGAYATYKGKKIPNDGLIINNTRNVFECIKSSYVFNGTVPSQKVVAAELNMDIFSVGKAFKQLKKMGYIQKGAKFRSYVITRERWGG